MKPAKYFRNRKKSERDVKGSYTYPVAEHTYSHIFFLFVCAVVLQGCHLSGEIIDLTQNSPDKIFQSKTQARELVPGSQQGVVTAQGYKVQSSFEYYKSPLMVTTSGGYKARSSVQAQIFKE